MRMSLILAAATVLLGGAGCGGEGTNTPSGSGSTTPALATSAPADRRLAEIFAQPGLADFLHTLGSAVDANDIQFFTDNTRFVDVDCDATIAELDGPLECAGAAEGETVPSITWGIWQSEGGYLSQRNYETFVTNSIGLPSGENASMYAAGQMTLGDDTSPDAIDVVVSGVASLSPRPSSGPALPEPAISLAIAQTEHGWQITEVDSAIVEFVPEFYEWWVPWEQAFSG
jgi:hypothetical protein